VAVMMISNKVQGDDEATAEPAGGIVVVGGASEAPPAPPTPAPPRFGSEDVFVAIAMVGDDESRVEGFTLTRPLDVRVLALGEATGGQMHDYGVILEATTRRAVWAMEADRTHHAGGAEKNRMVDEAVSLEAGDYLVYYVTDDSHSYGDWNSSAPSFPELWGITLMGAHGPPDRDVVRSYDDRDNDAVLARIVEARDDEHLVERFTVRRATDVRVYALGEGDSGEMYDYATIEDAATGEVVWRMTYPQTDHAGGGQKNRLFDGVIRLDAGEYELVYRTDGSHSFGDWNTEAPHDSFSYGVTVFRL
jgi:hypothetical protein